MPALTLQAFIERWKAAELSERASYQQHFIDLCRLLGEPTPVEADPKGERYTFEAGLTKTSGSRGYADVWKKGHFAWEYKGKHKDLARAYRQLLEYREALENPPLLVVCDTDRFEVHTNFTGTVKKVYAFGLEDLKDNLDVLRAVFRNPEKLRPDATTIPATRRPARSKRSRFRSPLRKRGRPWLRRLETCTPCGTRCWRPIRTLTGLYNERPTWLRNLHTKLDEAVFGAYGWPVDLSDDEVLERLLALNLDRAPVSGRA